jgi:hypothetical protein
MSICKCLHVQHICQTHAYGQQTGYSQELFHAAAFIISEAWSFLASTHHQLKLSSFTPTRERLGQRGNEKQKLLQKLNSWQLGIDIH